MTDCEQETRNNWLVFLPLCDDGQDQSHMMSRESSQKVLTEADKCFDVPVPFNTELGLLVFSHREAVLWYVLLPFPHVYELESSELNVSAANILLKMVQKEELAVAHNDHDARPASEASMPSQYTQLLRRDYLSYDTCHLPRGICKIALEGKAPRAHSQNSFNIPCEECGCSLHTSPIPPCELRGLSTGSLLLLGWVHWLCLDRNHRAVKRNCQY